MTEPRQIDLLYGHLGEAIYDADTREWHFSRKLGSRRLSKPLGTPCTTVPSTLLKTSAGILGATTSRRHIAQSFSANPTLAPAADFLTALIQVSEVICQTVSAYDPTVGELLSFGKAKDMNRNHTDRRLVNIAALTGGPVGEIVRLVRVGTKRFRCQGKVWTRVDVPSLEKGAIGYWIGNGSPILQLCFSTDINVPGSYLAVRCATLITIFRPLLQRWPVPPRTVRLGGRTGADYPPSTLDANPFLYLPIEHTGGVPFADVTFNPWNEQQLAIIDQHGCWSIWRVESEHRNRATSVLKVCSSGDLHDILQNESSIEAGNFNEDGWGLVLWAGNPNTILIANRRALVLYDVKARPEMFNMNLVPKTEWILDAKRDTENPSHVCVLTSTRLIWLHIRSDILEYKITDFARILLSWKHFRNHEDASLRLHMHSTNSVTTILLHSRLAELTTKFTFSISANGIPQSLMDPYVLPLVNASDGSDSKPTNLGALDPRQSIMTFVIGTAEGSLAPFVAASKPEISQTYKNSTFFQLFALQGDLSLTEQVYIDSESQIPLVDLSAEKSETINAMSSMRVAEDEFIVDDGLESEDEVVPRLASQSHERFRAENVEIGEDPRTVNMEWLADMMKGAGLHRRQGDALDDDNIPLMNLADQLEHLKTDAIANAEAFAGGIKTLYQVLEEPSKIDNLEETSNHLEMFMENMVDIGLSNDPDIPIVHIKDLLLSRFSDSSVLSLAGSGTKTSLITSYDTLVKQWITPLRPDIPARMRANLSRCLKTIALQICLTSHGLQKVPATKPNFEAAENKDADHLVLTVRRKASSGSLTDKVKASLYNDSQTLQQTSQSLSESALPALTRTSSTNSQASAFSFTHLGDEACQRLRCLASFHAQPPLSETTSKVLAHWQLEANPADYDWEATRKALQAPENEDDDRMKRKRKKDARRRMSQRNKADAPASLQAPHSLLSSQFNSTLMLPDSSQTAGPSSTYFASQGIGTQPLGLGASQKVLKKVRKKRKMGF